LIEANVALCRIPEEKYAIYQTTAEDFVRDSFTHKKAQNGQDRPAQEDGWDIVFFDPPYKEDYARTLELLGSFGGLLIVEHHHKNPLPETVGNLRRVRVLKQGDSSLSFYEG
jgi:16S rRNA G966 N2-methylase RsmD